MVRVFDCQVSSMDRKISIRFDQCLLKATLSDSPCALAIWDALPLSGFATRWGDEVYFPIPVDAPLESSRSTSSVITASLSRPSTGTLTQLACNICVRVI